MTSRGGRGLSLRQIRERLFSTAVPDAELLEMLGRDARAGARELQRQVLRRIAQERAEAERLHSLYGYERALEAAGCGPVAGTDEAGRGPLAGPVVAAAVVLSRGAAIPELKDSKQLTGPARSRLADEIRARCHAWGIGVADVGEIARLNILRASLLAMRRALDGLGFIPGWVLVDGSFTVPLFPGPQTALVKGDRVSASVAAASILAKVYRDELMERLHRLYPEYGFDRHKGYPTPEHYQALERYGPCPLHRVSFLHKTQISLNPTP
ncbi:ribonuclease HII [Candidatus Desulforudis audaxviator]|uniref:Ribonuclease HII n=1 Tax=Desulforudis audaxviator (strain MP104C) TaxID=477974 RepID=B1I2N5_DESAP|nr:ribonuclease HII [Candidatus Desulforudis audaxviator]ACA59198.1 Ribonuclease H [Candidatus Desulforudis audaxviator MP104C]